MKKEFSTKWTGSKQPRKQRKYIANAPLHRKRKLLSTNLIKELREKYKIRNIELRKDDKVKIMRGKFKGREGKIIKIKTKLQKVYIEGIQTKKQDGSKVDIPLKTSNLQIIELYLDDKKRMPQKTQINKSRPQISEVIPSGSDAKSQKTETPKKEIKSITKEIKKE
jgi:large subunit ribosomal protein L24